MTTISVDVSEKSNQWNCSVTVDDGSSTSSHEVTVSPDHLESYGVTGEPVEEVVEASFEFLLDREPKEAILSSFELDTIERYFPEFEDKLPSYL